MDERELQDQDLAPRLRAYYSNTYGKSPQPGELWGKISAGLDAGQTGGENAVPRGPGGVSDYQGSYDTGSAGRKPGENPQSKTIRQPWRFITWLPAAAAALVLIAGSLLVMWMAMSSHTPGGITGVKSTPTPTVPAASATSQPPATVTVPAFTVPSRTPTTAPATPTVAPTAVPVPALGNLQWKQAGQAGNEINGLATIEQGTGIFASGPNGVWQSNSLLTAWDKLGVTIQGRIVHVSAAFGSPQGIIYVVENSGCASGMPGVQFRSVDGGKTWQPLADGLMNIVGTGDTTAYALTCSGVSKSTDAGFTWTALNGSTVENYTPTSLAASPDGQTVVVAYTSEGGTGRVMQSTDGGQGWVEITPEPPTSGKLIGPGNLLYVASKGFYMTSEQGLWLLPSGTTQWTLKKIDDQSSGPGQHFWYTALAVDSVSSGSGPVLYLAKTTSDQQGQYGLGVFRSTDEGASWEQVGQGLDRRMVSSLAVVPGMRTVLAGTSDGVWAVTLPAESGTPAFYEDRTDPVAALRSFYNAIDRKEYERAYSYFQGAPNPDPSVAPPYKEFAAGYADTASVELKAGQVTQDAGAGNIYASLPVVLIATQTDGSTRTFAGCYTLHRVNTGISPNPKDELWSIRSATISAVQPGASLDNLLSQSCAP